jgi:hypothetical protein
MLPQTSCVDESRSGAQAARAGLCLPEETASGYLHAGYAHALAEFGEPFFLPEAGGWIFKRAIPGTAQWDAMGCYPLFACRDWRHLACDLEALEEQGELVSLTVVTDPFGDYELNDLRRAFPDLARPFKEHFVVDLRQPLSRTACAHHRRNARRALSSVEVDWCAPEAALDEWCALYQHLIRRHQVQGLAAFSRESFARQLRVPGMMVFRARHQGETVGMTLWYRSDERAYYHLAAYSPRGYELKASFALFWEAGEEFARAGVRWLALGGGAGINNEGADGLTRFKSGWATATRTAYLCGRIFDQRAYAKLAAAAGTSSETYFPAYRRSLPAPAQAPARSHG